MNKQEVIDKIRNLSTLKINDRVSHHEIDMVVKNHVLDIIEKLDEQKKPVLTEEEAEWVEGLKDEQKRRPFWTKYSMLYFVTRAGFGYGFSYDNDRDDKEVELKHYSHAIHAEKERLTNAILYGYEIEKKKLYTVEIPNPNSAGGKTILFKQKNTNLVIMAMLDENINKPEYLWLTEQEIRKDFEWAWQFAKEVEND